LLDVDGLVDQCQVSAHDRFGVIWLLDFDLPDRIKQVNDISSRRSATQIKVNPFRLAYALRWLDGAWCRTARSAERWIKVGL
jgi:hypothetical protein